MTTTIITPADARIAAVNAFLDTIERNVDRITIQPVITESVLHEMHIIELASKIQAHIMSWYAHDSSGGCIRSHPQAVRVSVLPARIDPDATGHCLITATRSAPIDNRTSGRVNRRNFNAIKG